MNINASDNEAGLTHHAIMAAIELLVARMDAIDAQCGDGFPLYSPGTQDHWRVSKGGSWVGGFWAGCWWLRARVTEAQSDRRKASQICQRLRPKMQLASSNISMLFWYGAALGECWFDDAPAKQLADTAATALAALYNPAMQCIAVGTDMAGGPLGERRITIDTLAPIIQLLSYRDDAGLQTVAQRHTASVIAACLHTDGRCHDTAVYQQARFQASGQAGAWSRGQAWAMLGLSKAALYWGHPYTDFAQSACVYWRDSRSQTLVPDRLDQTSAPLENSSSLIAALAMLSLSKLIPDGKCWVAYAQHQVARLISGQYFTRMAKTSNAAPAGIFCGACYQTRPNTHELVESAWGSFFLLQALCILAGIIDPTDCTGQQQLVGRSRFFQTKEDLR